ncbi:MAG: tetratricopeptide repeat protein [Candidatus Aminicenantes bacterium]|nr:tetratricopeptide repeat protein [Candidatus Aminicenantes bacterium]
MPEGQKITPPKNAVVPPKIKESGFRAVFAKLRKRRIIETLAAFIGGGWLLIEVVERLLVSHYHFPEEAIDITVVTLVGALLCTLIWRWFRSTEKRPGNIKIEVLLVPLIVLVALAIDLNLILQLASIPGKELLIGIIAFLLGIAWVIFKLSQWAANTPAVGAKKFDISKLAEIKPGKSIVVLPFVNISPEEGQDYFCDGLTEEIINALSHIRELRVVARTSAFAFKGKEIDIREVGEILNVNTVLEGSVRKAGDRLRITAQLINVADGYHLWSERFDREMKDIFNIQDEVTLEIVDKLKIELLGKEREQVVKRYTDNLEAHNLLLKGWYFWGKRTKEGVKRGLECVHQALEIDPAYALAHAQLAMNLISLGAQGFTRPHEAFPKAKAAARKALELDGSLPQAYAALAWISFFYDWDWTAAEKGFKKALFLNPGLGYAYFGYAVFLVSRSRFEEAVPALKRAVELDPLSLWMNAELGYCFRLARRYDEAQEQLNKTVEMDPNFGLAHYYMGILYSDKGMYKEAIAEIQRSIELAGGLSWAFGYLGYAYAMLGQKDETEKILRRLEERSKEEYIGSTTFWILHSALGDIDKSFECLEKAIEEHEPLLPLMNVLPEYDIVRSDPRFKAFLKKMNLNK